MLDSLTLRCSHIWKIDGWYNLVRPGNSFGVQFSQCIMGIL